MKIYHDYGGDRCRPEPEGLNQPEDFLKPGHWSQGKKKAKEVT